MCVIIYFHFFRARACVSVYVSVWFLCVIFVSSSDVQKNKASTGFLGLIFLRPYFLKGLIFLITEIRPNRF